MLLCLFVVIHLITGVLLHSCNNEHKDEFDDVQIGVVISPVMSNKMIREIGIYWKNPNIKIDGDNIGLYDKDPNFNDVLPIFKFTPDVQHGFKKTGISADFIPTSKLSFYKKCLGYYVAWIRNNIVKKTNCLSTNPSWMGDRRKTLEHLKMRDIFLPGTHDSAAYAKHKNSQLELIVDKYTITQDEDVLAQLIYGARYLDIRIGRYPNHENIFWGNHGPFRIVPLKTVINAVKFFLDKTDEIIIFDVQEFPIGFKTMAAHYELTDYLEEEFAGYLLHRPTNGWKIKLDEIWNSNRRLIIGYDYASVVASRTCVWPQVGHQWGNVRTIGALYKHLNKVETQAAEESFNPNPSSQPRAAMAQLTPTTFDIIFDRLGGLRKMAENVDINVTEWYSEEWQHTANIVAVDFLKATGIVETAIEWNDKRAAGC